MTVAGLVLAAGAGSRYGRPKALVPWSGGLLAEHVAGVLAEGGCADPLVVLGAAADEVRARATRLPRTVVNPDWATGLASSLRVGLAALSDTPAVAALILLGDMPGVTPAAVRRIVALADPGVLAVCGYHGRRGHPVLLGREHWAEVAATASGDRGARDYLRAHAARVHVVDVGAVADDTDLDVPARA